MTVLQMGAETVASQTIPLLPTSQVSLLPGSSHVYCLRLNALASWLSWPAQCSPAECRLRALPACAAQLAQGSWPETLPCLVLCGFGLFYQHQQHQHRPGVELVSGHFASCSLHPQLSASLPPVSARDPLLPRVRSNLAGFCSTCSFCMCWESHLPANDNPQRSKNARWEALPSFLRGKGDSSRSPLPVLLAFFMAFIIWANPS